MRALLAVVLGALALLVGTAGPTAAAACPAPGACVVVHLVGDRQGTTTVSVSDISAWAASEGFPPADYRIRAQPGGPTHYEGVSQSLPLRALIAHLAERGGAFAGLQSTT